MSTSALIADPQEARDFLTDHPEIEFFEVIFTAMSGVPRGKRLRRHELMAVYEYGRFLPGSILVCDITGQDCEDTGLVWEDGDADRLAKPAPGTLAPAPWLGADVAQVLTSLYELDGTPNDIDPRHVLRRVLDRFAADGLTPVVACELEYYLVDSERTAAGGVELAASLATGERPTLHGVYGLRELEDFSGFLRDLWVCADAQGVPLEGAIAEYAPGQLELDLEARAGRIAGRGRGGDVQAHSQGRGGQSWLRGHLHGQAVRQPGGQRPASARQRQRCEDGNNIFASDDPAGAPALRHAIGGLKATLADGMAIFAPNANSYRRFRANSYAPVAPTWGVNNRTVSLRVPAGPPGGRHVEHRVAGADANPYLAMAALLAGVHHGLSNAIDPGPPVRGDGYAAAAQSQERLPANWFFAIEQFQRSAVMRDYLGERFVRMFSKVKQTEQDRFFEVVSPLDYDWYLKNA